MFPGTAPPSPGGAKGGSNKLFFMLPLMFISQKLPLTDEKFIQMLRIIYYTVQALMYGITIYIRQQIESHPDRNKTIYIPKESPNPLASFLGVDKEKDGEQAPGTDPDAPKKTTYMEHELELLGAVQKSTVMGAVMATGLHFYMGVKPILFMQSCMGPLTLFENPLFKKYVLGGGKVEEGLYGESTESPAPEQVSSSTTTKKKPIEGKASTSTTRKVMSEELLQRILGAEEVAEKCEAKELEDIVDNYLTKDNINDTTPTEGWTSLMVFCGHPNITKEILQKVLTLKPNVMLQDDEGDTALHFALGNSKINKQDEPVITLLTDAGLSKEDKIKLITTANNQKETVLDLCKENASEVVKEMIESEAKTE